ncbi:hypothetical protein MG293_017291 [Ovis ammon polii]|uniref:Uncharacterized protein n=1 Tax=Ovis ammon polii TaxID=230172 RepID=A0AAD4TS04_OVIAM|nr:hypothetical protein MG293_017291 [Ovis ammon polii]
MDVDPPGGRRGCETEPQKGSDAARFTRDASSFWTEPWDSSVTSTQMARTGLPCSATTPNVQLYPEGPYLEVQQIYGTHPPYILNCKERMLLNTLHSQHDPKSKKHRETNYWRKMTPKDLPPHDENDSLVSHYLARSGKEPVQHSSLALRYKPQRRKEAFGPAASLVRNQGPSIELHRCLHIPQTFSLAHLGFLSGPPPQTVATDGRTPSYLCEKLSGYE